MHAGRDSFTTSGYSPVNTVIFNSLIWHFTLFEAVCYGFYQPVFIETVSLERLPPKAEEFFLPMRQTIPRRTPTRYFKASGNMIITIFIIVFIIIIIIYYTVLNAIWQMRYLH